MRGLGWLPWRLLARWSAEENSAMRRTTEMLDRRPLAAARNDFLSGEISVDELERRVEEAVNHGE